LCPGRKRSKQDWFILFRNLYFWECRTAMLKIPFCYLLKTTNNLRTLLFRFSIVIAYTYIQCSYYLEILKFVFTTFWSTVYLYQ
jgi:hypothetical protein